MSGWVAAAIAGSALVGAGSSIYGANKAANAAKPGPNPRVGDPFSDPLMLGISQEALQGLGFDAGLTGMDERGSPVNQFINEIEGSGVLTSRVKRNANVAIRWYIERGLDPFDTNLLLLNDKHEPWKPGDIPLVPRNIQKLRPFVNIATSTIGFRGFNDWAGLAGAETQYQDKITQFRAQSAPLLESIRKNRLLGQANLADIAGTAGMRTEDLAALYEPQIARQFQDERNRILQTANQGRFNPGAALGRLSETQALSQKTSAIERALQILGGQANITQSALAPAQQFGLLASEQRQGGQLNLASIGAAQAQAQAQLRAEAGAAQGTGIASAGGQIGNIGLLLALLGQNTGPAGTTTSPNSVQTGQAPFNPLAFLGGAA